MCYPSWHKKARRHTLLTTTMAGRPPTSPWWIHFEKVDGTHPWFAYFPNDNLRKAFIRVAKQHLTPPSSFTNLERHFSYGGLVATDYRASLSGEKLDQILFLRENALMANFDLVWLWILLVMFGCPVNCTFERANPTLLKKLFMWFQWIGGSK